MMNGIPIIMIGATVVIVSCSPIGIEGDGVETSTDRPIAEFSTLKADGAYQITWSSGKPGLTISTDQNLLPLISTSVTGGTLKIEQKENLRPTKGITIIVSSSTLKGVQLNGAGSLTASNVSGPDLKLESNGVWTIKVEGLVKNLEADLSGAGSLHAKALQTEIARLSLNGACTADVTVTGSLDASISGAGEITYGGNPKTVEKSVNGAGKIQSRR